MNVRRSLVIAASLAAMAAGVPAAVAMPTAPAAGAVAAPSKTPYVLKVGKGPAKAALSGLAGKLKTVKVQTLVDQKGHRTGKWGGGCRGAAAVPSGAKWFCFDSGDSKTKEWIPQGVTTVSDARKNGKWGDEKPIIVGSYDGDKKKPHKSARITFVNTKNSTYRHVLLIWPQQTSGGKTTYVPVGTRGSGDGIHAGGLAWYGNRLYVADTGAGIRVFDMRRIYDLGASANGSTKKPEWVGLHGNTYYGHGNRYVMPQVSAYVPNRKSGTVCSGSGTPKHSWLSIDRSGGNQLVTGEWCPNGNGRVAEFRLASDSGSGNLVTSGGKATPSVVARLPEGYVQGGATAGSSWWFSRNVPSTTGRKRGQLLSATYSGGAFKNVTRTTISYGPEDLSCWRGAHQVWTVAEHAGQRALYGMKKSQCK